jgi:hypothetical protein
MDVKQPAKRARICNCNFYLDDIDPPALSIMVEPLLSENVSDVISEERKPPEDGTVHGIRASGLCRVPGED